MPNLVEIHSIGQRIRKHKLNSDNGICFTLFFRTNLYTLFGQNSHIPIDAIYIATASNHTQRDPFLVLLK